MYIQTQAYTGFKNMILCYPFAAAIGIFQKKYIKTMAADASHGVNMMSQ